MWLEWKDKLARGKPPAEGVSLSDSSQVSPLVDAPYSVEWDFCRFDQMNYLLTHPVLIVFYIPFVSLKK